MTYIGAAAELIDELARAASVGPIRAALRLTVLAWRELGDTDPAWDRFGLQVLAVEELLRGLPMSVVACDAPDSSDPAAVRRAVADLLGAVADRLDLASQGPTGSVAGRLGFDAAAGMLRRAIGLLP